MPSLEVGYVWHAGVHAAEVAEGLRRIGFEIVAQVIWDKGLFAMGRSWYHWGHEPCWVVLRKGAKVPFAYHCLVRDPIEGYISGLGLLERNGALKVRAG